MGVASVCSARPSLIINSSQLPDTSYSSLNCLHLSHSIPGGDYSIGWQDCRCPRALQNTLHLWHQRPCFSSQNSCESSVVEAEAGGFGHDQQALQLSFQSHLKLLLSASFHRHYKRRHFRNDRLVADFLTTYSNFKDVIKKSV